MVSLLLISLLTPFRFLQLGENMFDSSVFLFILRLSECASCIVMYIQDHAVAEAVNYI